MSRSDGALALSGDLASQVLDNIDDPTFVADADGRIRVWNRAATEFYGIAAVKAIGRIATELLTVVQPDFDRDAEAARQLASGRPWHAEAIQETADGRCVPAHVTVQPISDGHGGIAYATTVRDLTDRREVERQRDLLAAAVDQAAESVVITDRDANILYVNPAFEKVSGYCRNEVIGRNPRILKSGAQGDPFYRRMWDRLATGEVFRAEFTNLRKDGSRYQEVTTISPVRDADGVSRHYVAVKRDVTRERAFARRIDGEARDRAAAMEAIGMLRPGANAEDTAHAIATALVDRCSFAHVALFSFEADDQAITLTTVTDDGDGATLPRVLTMAASRAMIERAAAGPWIEKRGPSDGDRRAVELGVLGHAPIHFGGDVVGLLSVASSDDTSTMADRLAFLVELAAMAGCLIGPALDERRAGASTRSAIQAVIDTNAFRSVFQPLVDLSTGTVVGQEALTRFDDQSPPDVIFATAARCGIGLDLEERTIEAALAAADSLPANGPIHINVSPAMILEEERLRNLLGRWGWNVTLEVTEHDPIENYEAIRAALARIGPDLELAVDDAGAGYASLRHILELGPHVVKLDRFLVAAIDADPTRQALVAGMVHFAASTGFLLLAEGIETEAERTTLLALGVTRGQGWLFGRPIAAPARSGNKLLPITRARSDSVAADRPRTRALNKPTDHSGLTETSERSSLCT